MKQTYKEKLTKAMTSLVKVHNFFVIGQGAKDGGHGMSATIETQILDKCIELPVFEETQTGIALGMGLSGLNVISIYPRFDFFVSGLSQLINHSDKLKVMSGAKFKPNIIFRVGIGSKYPLDAGPQHTNNYTKQVREMLTNISVHELKRGTDPQLVFNKIIEVGGINLVTEHYEYYEDLVCGN